MVFDIKLNVVYNCCVLLDFILINCFEWMVWYVVVVRLIVFFWFFLVGVFGWIMVYILGLFSWVKYLCKIKYVFYYIWWYFFGIFWWLVKLWLVFWGFLVGLRYVRLNMFDILYNGIFLVCFGGWLSYGFYFGEL